MAASVEDPLFRLSEDVTQDDIPTMAAIGHEAFLDDTHTNLKKHLLPEKTGVDDSGIHRWLAARERCHVIKAVHNSTNEIMGFICWAHRGYVPRPPQPEATAGRFSEVPSEDKRSKVQVMEDMEDQHFVDFMTEIMPEEPNAVSVLRTDLDAYAEGNAVAQGPGVKGKWGVYTIRYMVYGPERVGSAGWKVITDVEATPLS
ncbi:hypothetical protein AB5N19_01671 [Seiridium cardinale]